jgi:hypothetical protein
VSGCEAIAIQPPAKFGGGVSWGESALACDGQPEGQCAGDSQACIPTAPEGFQQCIYYARQVDELEPPACPVEYPERLTFYRSYVDGRSCTECTCGQPAGAICKASITAYEDPSCAAAVFMHPVDLAAPDLCISQGGMPGYTISGMSASWNENTPGHCEASGGELTGSVIPTDPRVFCCKPSP